MPFLKHFWFNSKNHIRHTCYACPPFAHTGLLFAFLIMTFQFRNFRNFSCPINIRFSRTKMIGAENRNHTCFGSDFGTWSRLFGPRFFGPVGDTNFDPDLKVVRILVQTWNVGQICGFWSENNLYRGRLSGPFCGKTFVELKIRTGPKIVKNPVRILVRISERSMIHGSGPGRICTIFGPDYSKFWKSGCNSTPNKATFTNPDRNPDHRPDQSKSRTKKSWPRTGPERSMNCSQFLVFRLRFVFRDFF